MDLNNFPGCSIIEFTESPWNLSYEGITVALENLYLCFMHLIKQFCSLNKRDGKWMGDDKHLQWLQGMYSICKWKKKKNNFDVWLFWMPGPLPKSVEGNIIAKMMPLWCFRMLCCSVIKWCHQPTRSSALKFDDMGNFIYTWLSVFWLQEK